MKAKGKNQQPNQPTCIDRIGGRTQAATTCEEASAPTPLSKVLRNSPIPFPSLPSPIRMKLTSRMLLSNLGGT